MTCAFFFDVINAQIDTGLGWSVGYLNFNQLLKFFLLKNLSKIATFLKMKAEERPVLEWHILHHLVNWDYWAEASQFDCCALSHWLYSPMWVSLHSDAERLHSTEQFWRTTRMQRPLQRARLGTLIEETSMPSCLFQNTHTSRKRSWLKLGENVLTAAWACLTVPLLMPLAQGFCSCGALQRLGATSFPTQLCFQGVDLRDFSRWFFCPDTIRKT